MFLAGMLLLLVVALPGYSLFTAFGESLRSRLPAVEAIYLILLSGVLAVSLPAILLAELGWFSLGALLAILGVGSVLTLAWARLVKKRSLNSLRGLSFSALDLLPFVLIAVAAFFAREPFEYIVGGRDHGVYVNTGVHIAKSGAILVQDPELAALPAESRQVLIYPAITIERHGFPGPWSEGQRLPGLTIRDAAGGVVLPHALHLYPVWIAIFYSVGGLPFALATTVVLALLGLLAVYVVGKQLFGREVALLTLFFLLVNVSQMWFVRYPSAEILIRFLYWGGLFTAGLMLTSESKLAAILAGACFGFMHLTKLDMVFVFPVLLLFFGYLWFKGSWKPHYRLFVATYGALALLALLHAIFLSTIYFLDQTTRDLLPSFLARRLAEAATGNPYPLSILGRFVSQNALLVAVSILGVAVFLWLAYRFRGNIGGSLRWLESQGWLSTALVVTLLVLMGAYAVALFLSRPAVPMERTVKTVGILSWYMTPLGLLLGLVGLGHFIAFGRRQSTNLVWLLLLGNMIPLLIVGTVTSPDHFWSIRRFVPIIIPSLILFACRLLWELRARKREEWARGLLALGLGIALFLGFWQDTRPVLDVVEYEGLTEQLADLSESFPEEAVLLVENSDVASRITLPIWFVFERTVFTATPERDDDPNLLAAIRNWQADDRPVFWLDADEGRPPLSQENLAHYVETVAISVPLVERVRDGIPDEAGRYTMALDAYRLGTETQGEESVVRTLRVSDGSQDELLSGLYFSDWLEGLPPRRWTDREVHMRFPGVERPLELLLMMGSGRPESLEPATVSVYSGGRHLATLQVGQRPQIYVVPLPDDLSISPDGIEFRLEIETWMPAEVIGSEDDRTLGVYLDWAKLIVSGVETVE
jgi:hypothetical protein